ncbi:MAG TPA: flagellar biosynthetic protein FliO [Bacillota bacterium]|nr:flagellar biosynthetic protein FliO [Clostridiales bacterium]HOQ15096.1 flagellar biosynthetic protein FliO [Bacillota bacterium]
MTFWDYFKVILAIAAVIASAFYLPRLALKSRGRVFGNQKSPMKLIGTLPLAKDKAVVLIEVGEYIYLLGVGSQNIEKLDKMRVEELNLKTDSDETSNHPTDNGSGFMKELLSRLGRKEL